MLESEVKKLLRFGTLKPKKKKHKRKKKEKEKRHDWHASVAKRKALAYKIPRVMISAKINY